MYISKNSLWLIVMVCQMPLTKLVLCNNYLGWSFIVLQHLKSCSLHYHHSHLLRAVCPACEFSYKFVSLFFMLPSHIYSSSCIIESVLQWEILAACFLYFEILRGQIRDNAPLYIYSDMYHRDRSSTVSFFPTGASQIQVAVRADGKPLGSPIVCFMSVSEDPISLFSKFSGTLMDCECTPNLDFVSDISSQFFLSSP
jgi:hypothetical protein